jgi:hypothetical protein
MNENSYIGDRERKIAEIFREYSKSDVDRAWLCDKKRVKDNVFKDSFYDIYKYTSDFDQHTGDFMRVELVDSADTTEELLQKESIVLLIGEEEGFDEPGIINIKIE